MSEIKLTTTRLCLEPLGIKYLESTHLYASDLENTRYMVHLPNKNRQETIDFLTSVDEAWRDSKQTVYEFAIIHNKMHIGAVSLYVDNNRIGELGWIINKRYWNQGYATEASKALMVYAITELGINHFIAHCDSENIGSYKIMENLGMILKEKTLGRKNKASDEVREELLYEYII